MRRKIILDCGSGIDTVFALAYMAACRDFFSLEAVTAVSCSDTAEKTVQMILDTMELFGLEAPVAKGQGRAVVRESSEGLLLYRDLYPEEGMLPVSRREAVKEPAVLFLYRILQDLPAGEKITIAATGPLTNLALLFLLYPQVKEKLQEIVFMGGAACAGDVTPSAEYNMYADPEAARIVLRSGVPFVMCALDGALNCTLTRKQILKMCQSGSPAAKLCGDLAGRCLENTANKYRGRLSIYGVVPLMFLAHPEFFEIKPVLMDVDCSEGPARGTVLCDFRWWEHDTEGLRSFILMRAEEEKFQECLITALFELGEAVEARIRGRER